ncbi:MAG TPA: thiamine pyrophosphate-binding protein [Solirubrobacterales bacterium]|nr:thiamine pyrophosphate-binding protein [Solirubrobacterales bacterium]
MTGQTSNFTEAVASAIAAESSHAFGLMGAGTIRLTHHLTHDHGVTYHAARHEAGAIGAADGYARVTRRTGVSLITWGPALTNTATALTVALRAKSSLVLVAGDASGVPTERNLFAAGTQGFDQRPFLDVLGVPVVRARSRTASRDVARAFVLAREERSPVALLLPMENELAPAVNAPEPESRPAPTPIPLDEEALGPAAAALRAAERPIVLAGGGAIRAEARDAIIQLADAVGALLATTLRSKDLFADHPYNLGVAGGFSPDLTAGLFARADCVVAFGASLNHFTTKRRQLFAGATVIHCDVDPEAIIRHGAPSIPLRGDAGEVASQLKKAIGPGLENASFREEALAAGLAKDSWKPPFKDLSSPGALDPRAVCDRLDIVLPRERTVVTDSGAVNEFPASYLSVPDPEALLWLLGDFGAIGTGIAPAIGAAVGRPDRLTVFLSGDGGLIMAIQELDLAVRERLPLLVVCLNDRAYGSEFHHMRDDGLPEVPGARFETPDLAEVARAFGCHGERIESLDQLDSLPERLASLDRPLLLDVMMTQELVPSLLRRHSGPPSDG